MSDMRLRTGRIVRILLGAAVLACSGLLAAGLAGDRREVQRPRREPPVMHRDAAGPTPPQGVDAVGKIFGLRSLLTSAVIPGVPAYLWRHGSGPTAVGMVLGYYDGRGFPDLLPGDAAVQTDAVSAAIASAEHYADYSLPIDAPPTILPDRSELAENERHVNNSLADYLWTSWSLFGNYYGVTASPDIRYGTRNYVGAVSAYSAFSVPYNFRAVPWSSIRSEILDGRPVIFLVDSDGSGGSDLYVTVIGVNSEDGTDYYGCYTTWDRDLHWFPYRETAPGVAWGVSIVHTVFIARAVFPPQGLRLEVLTNDFLFFRESVNRLTWEANPANGNRVVAYKIYRKAAADPDTEYRLLGERKPDEPAFDDRGLRAGVSYAYRVTSVDESGHESAPATAAN